MPYQIKNGNIVAKDTQGHNKSFIKANVDAIIAQCKADGITNRYVIAGILATVSKESQFVPQDEKMGYSANRLIEIFPTYFKNGRASSSDYASQPEKIGNYIYGYEWKDGVKKIGRGGNDLPGDGYKFRGRGFNQITFKSAYKKYGKNIGVDLISNPTSLNSISNAAKALVSFYKECEKDKKNLKSKFNKSSLNDFDNWDQALLCIVNMTAGFNSSTSSSVVKWAYDNAKKCHSFLIEYLEKNPQGTIAPPENPSNVDNKAQEQQNQDQSAQQSNDTQQSDTSSDSGSSNNSPNNGQPIKNLTQFFSPSISPKELNFDSGETGKNDKQKVSKQLGYMPFIWYNGFQIAYQDISKFSLYHKGMLPAVEITFLDTLGVLREDGFPHDDTVITIYLNSKSLNLRSIHMDFKILDFKDNGSNSYTIVGICDIPQIYLKKFSSYNGKTSHEALQEVAKQVGIGFCSNIQNSDDKMTWINTGFKIIEFIENIIGNSYVSETSFQYCYVDFYYNLCYMDLNKEMERDVTNDKQVVGFGYKFLDGKEENPDTDEETIDLILTNEKAAKESISFFSTFELVNKSTRVSLDKSYRTRSKFYDTISKELLVFDVESQTSDGSKSIILKGASNDDKFFQDNTSNIWIGKQDMYDDGKGNVHKNYNYSVSQNRINLDDITKISCKLHLPNNNFNLYIYQKVPIYFMPQKESPTIKNSVYKRISGDWLITNIGFEFEGGKSHQVITAVKRELSILPEEQGESKPRSNSNANNNENNVNELSPNDQASPNPTPNSPGSNVSNTPNAPGQESNATSIDSPSNNKDNLQGTNSKLLFTAKNGNKYIVNPSEGIAGKRLKTVPKDLQDFLQINGYPGAIIKSNGIMRDLKGATYPSNPKRAKGSLHGSGLAIDLIFNIPGFNWKGIGDNENLSKDEKLVKTIWRWVQSQKDLTWGAEWGKSNPSNGNIKGWGITEFHHMEIKKDLIKNYWSPFTTELSELGFKGDKLTSTSNLQKLYEKLLA